MFARLSTLLTLRRPAHIHPDWFRLYLTGKLLCWLGVVLLVALFLTGCRAMGTKVTEEELFGFQRGTTSCFDIVATRGKPTLNELHADGTRTITYAYSQSQFKWESFIPGLDALVGGQTAETTQVVIWCDVRNILTGYTATQGQTTLGHGISSGGRQ